MPVFITFDFNGSKYGLDTLPQEAYGELPHSVVIDGLAEERFYGASMKGAEKDFIVNKLHAHSGHELEFHDVAANKEEYRKLARMDAQKILQAYAAASPPSI